MRGGLLTFLWNYGTVRLNPKLLLYYEKKPILLPNNGTFLPYFLRRPTRQAGR